MIVLVFEHEASIINFELPLTALSERDGIAHDLPRNRRVVPILNEVLLVQLGERAR